MRHCSALTSPQKIVSVKRKTLGNASKIVNQGTLYAIGRRLTSLHVPFQINYAERFGLDKSTSVPLASSAAEAQVNAEGPSCKHCAGNKGSILYGKYGYYLKCSGCDGNTSVRAECGIAGHQAKIRKERLRFFHECEACGSSALYFVNPDQ